MARSIFPRSAARPISSSRAAAATRRSCDAICGVVLLPNVPASYGVRAVSAMTRRMRSTGVCNSSATTWVSEVRMFWPISTLPV